MTRHTCNACGSTDFAEVLDLGEIPIAHRFVSKDSNEPEYKHPLTVHLCNSCALIQILNPIPPAVLYEDYNFCFTSWKPQPHIAEEVALILSCVGPQAMVFEIGANDGGFLLELRKNGMTRIAGVEPNRVSSQIGVKQGLKVYNAFFDAKIADEVAKEHGAVDLVVSRQVVEHIPDLRGLMAQIRRILRKDGYLLFEVPDFEVPMKHGDCSALWEEHVNYFTEPVMRDFLAKNGFEVEKVQRFPFSGGALMVLARQKADSQSGVGAAELEGIKKLALAYRGRVDEFRTKVIKMLEANRAQGKTNVLYGAGCRANALINGLKLGPYLQFVVDDQPEKQAYLMPGCRLRILPSEALSESDGICLLSVNCENEEKVIGKHAPKLGGKWEFYSLNSPSPLLKKLGV